MYNIVIISSRDINCIIINDVPFACVFRFETASVSCSQNLRPPFFNTYYYYY